MKQFFKESLIIIDEIPWLYGLIETTLQSCNYNYVRFASNVRLRDSFNRFQKSPFIIIHWEGKARSGGAIVEEIREIAPDFPIKERVIIVTSNPTHEDVYYFNELNIYKIVSANKLSEGNYQTISREIKKGLEAKIPPPSAWQEISQRLDALNPESSSREADYIEKKILEAHKANNRKYSASYYDSSARLAYHRRQIKRAKQLWYQALDINPNHFRSYQNLVNFYEKEGQYDQALALMHQLNKLNKHSISRTVRMGEIHQKLLQTNKAEHYFNLALEKDEFCSRALNGLAEIRFDQGSYEEARSLLEKSTYTKKTASYLNQKGIELVHKRRFEQALEVYKKAQYVLPNQEKGPLLFFNIGLCYSRWGKINLAREYLKLALIKEPTYEKASRLLNRLTPFISQTST